MSDKNDTNESLEEGQEALPPGDAEPTEVTEVTEVAEVAEATEATGGENMIHKAQNASGKLMSFSAPAAYFLGAALFLVMALSISNKVSQVDDMLNALTKRAVSMNSAIASFEELNITIQDMGAIQDEFLDQQNLMLIVVNEIKTQIPAETAFKVAAENAVVGSKINQLEDTLDKQSITVAKVTNSMVGLSSRIEKFENSLVDVKRLTDDVDALITLERENYMEVLQRQTILQEAQSGKQVVKVPRDPNLIFYSIKTP